MSKLPALKELTQFIEKGSDGIGKVLPPNMSVSRFVSKANNAIMTHPQRDKLLNADRMSLFNAIKKAASDGLEIDGREAALVVFNSKVGNEWVPQAQYMPMVQGLVKLARNSGQIKSIDSEVVFENDHFKFGYDINGNIFEHEPNVKGDRGEPVLVWALIRLVDGGNVLRALTKDDVMNVAKSSKNAKQYNPNEGQYYKEWWRKAAIKNALKYAPKSTELEKLEEAVEADNQAQGFEFNDAPVSEESITISESKKKTKTAEIINDDIIDVEVTQEEEEIVI